MATKGSKKQFCLRGHDTFVYGRTKQGACKECRREDDRIDSTVKDSRLRSICVNGHDTTICGRDTNRCCRLCSNKSAKEYRENNKDACLAINRKWKADHKDEVAAYDKQWIKEHRELVNENRRKYVAKYPGRVKQQALEQDTNRNLRIVSWGQEGIEEFYDNKPKEMEGDHIIPLQGDVVSGLHVYWNLQYLTHSQNSRKGNRCTPEEATKYYEQILTEAGLK